MIHQSTIVVRYAETDQMGIVHHSVYPIWYEIGRTDFCRALGVPYSEMEATGVMTPLIEMGSRFIFPARYEDRLMLETRLIKLDSVRLKFAYKVHQEAGGKLINTGTTTHMWVSSKSFKMLHLKNTYPDLYAKLKAAVSENG